MFVLLLITFLDTLSLNLITPALIFVFYDHQSSLFSPTTTETVRSHWYGVMISLPYFAAMIATPLLTGLSDRYGRKAILFVASLGALVFAICGGLGIVSGMLWIMLIGKFTGGLCARSEPTALAALIDMSPPAQRAVNIGLLQAIIAFGAFSAPIVGGYITRWHFAMLNFSAAFWLAALTALLSLCAVTFFKESYIARKEAHPTLWGEWRQFFSSSLLYPVIMMLLIQFSWSMYYQFIPPILKQYYHYSASSMGWFVGLIALWITLASLYGVRWIKSSADDNRLIQYCIYTMLIGFILNFLSYLSPESLFCQVLLWLGALFIPVGDVIAYCLIVAMLSHRIDSTNQGKAMGFCFLLAYSAWGVTALLGGYLAGVNIILPIIIAPVMLLLAILYWLKKR